MFLQIVKSVIKTLICKIIVFHEKSLPLRISKLYLLCQLIGKYIFIDLEFTFQLLRILFIGIPSYTCKMPKFLITENKGKEYIQFYSNQIDLNFRLSKRKEFQNQAKHFSIFLFRQHVVKNRQ